MSVTRRNQEQEAFYFECHFQACTQKSSEPKPDRPIEPRGTAESSFHLTRDHLIHCELLILFLE